MIKAQSKIRVSQLAVVLFAAALAGSAPAKSRGNAGGDGCVSVPFKGRSGGHSIAVSFDPVAGISYGRVEGKGRASHVGRFTVTADVAVEVATGIPHGTWTITAANGDELFMDMTGHGIDAHHGFGEFTITGGTGRFEGATGYYEQIITFAVPLGTADVIAYTDVFEGTICLAHSNGQHDDEGEDGHGHHNGGQRRN
jgi:hypothetical protein